MMSTLLLAPLLLSACNGATDTPAVVSSPEAAPQTLVTEPVSPPVEIAKPKEVITPSLNNKQSSATYLAPETLSNSLRHPVNDFTTTLSAAELEFLNEKASRIYEEGLLQVGVVIVSTTGDMPLLDYAMTVAKTWALGSPENHNGLVIVVALDDKSMYILTGLDIDDTLTDERVASIIEKDITPHFRRANYVTGLSAGMDALVWEMRQ